MTFKIGRVNKSSPHLMADLAELLLWIGYEGYTSLHKSDLQSITNNEPLSLDEIGSELDGQDQTDNDANEALDTVFEDCWAQFEYRAGAFGDYYPFSIENREIALKSDLTSGQRLYGLLLCTSRLRSFSNRSLISKWAGFFAELCRYAMKGLLPNNAVVHVFDSNSEDRRKIYGVDRREALIRLGKKIQVSVNEDVCREGYSSGDNGLDIVGYIDFGDEAKGTHTIFGQCAAQEDGWPDKIFEAHPLKFVMMFSFPSPPTNVVFIPLCYRKATGAWVQDSKVSGCILIDRVRIIKLIAEQNLQDEIPMKPWFNEFQNALDTQFRGTSEAA